ncbi:MAG: bifunctional [glutamine synthetase] adenylyltransferase/[glutamine synthetase]-adenylyl-L-tyrosine phosphorylase [Rhodobacteraceae bacterium]|nr:bifunctional [glutamine synthetase] adenylyltransferase/[glutamine synthetase]-adenylyl-L-tyrosine phosphorylase [Paracoccaceae bacterium]
MHAQLDISIPRAADPDALQRNWADWGALGKDHPDVATFIAASATDSTWKPLLDGIFGSSPYLSASVKTYPEIAARCAGAGFDAAFDDVIAGIDAIDCNDGRAVMPILRQAKSKAALLIGLADLAGAWPVLRVTEALSDVADATVRQAVRTLLREAHAKGEVALADERDPERNCGYTILALGKHGGRELNYSSDIDLYVLFDDDTLPYTGRKSKQEFAVTLTRDFVRIMQERTGDGYVFRTDLRLRPDPGSTKIAVSRQAASIYYESYGQNWERAALIKARHVAGDAELARAFLKDIETFIWRRSLDFYALQDIHSIKRQIYAHKGGGTVAVAGHNIKLGRGGIREIEFFAQTQQLIWGGRHPEARSSRTLEALDALVALGVVKSEVRDELRHAYEFLRSLEHRLQMINDEQTQKLPEDEMALRHVAAFSGFESLDAFERSVTKTLLTVETHYAALFEDSTELTVGGNLVFTGTEDDPDTVETLTRLGFTDASMILRLVRSWHIGKYRATRTLRARQILTELMPALLIAFGKTTEADQAFMRFDQCLAQLNSGVQILSVLQANPKILDLVAEIMGDAPRLADGISHNPALLDFVLDPEFFTPIDDADGMLKELSAHANKTPDFETFCDVVRRWANEQRFRIGVQILRSIIDPVKGAQHLSDVADAVLKTTVPRVHDEFAGQYGRVPDSELTVIAYGKLGSCELTPTSDLDLVMVYTGTESTPSQGTKRSLPASAYYIRLAQRIVTVLTALSAEGRLYEVDLRLRPQGAKGPLACSVEAFVKYMNEDAWTWEHMALTRARVVVASPEGRVMLESTIESVLNRTRPADALVAAVGDMRERMRREHKAEELWQIKRRRGGLIDIEFAVQYLRLCHPAPLAIVSRGIVGMIRHFAEIGALPRQDAKTLEDSFALLARLQIMIRLCLPGDTDQPPFPEGLENKLCALAHAGSFAKLESTLTDFRDAVTDAFRRLIEQPAAQAREKLGDTTLR